MKKRFREALSARCKDMGITDRAIDNLTELGCKGLKEDSTDEEFNTAVDFVVPFAKEIQAEITRKTSKNKPSQKQSNGEGENEGETHDNQPQGNGNDNPLNEILKRLSNLEKENKNLREERIKADRKAALKAELKGQGINDFLGDYINVPEGADVKEFVTKFKQGYISANLPTKDDALDQGGSSLDKRKQEAEDWVKRNFKVD